MAIRDKDVKYEITVTVIATGRELITKTNGDLFSITPRVAVDLAREKVYCGAGDVSIQHLVKREPQVEVSIDANEG